jgi:hypothetical protein
MLEKQVKKLLLFVCNCCSRSCSDSSVKVAAAAAAHNIFETQLLCEPIPHELQMPVAENSREK